jgi:hypothetical protein
LEAATFVPSINPKLKNSAFNKYSNNIHNEKDLKAVEALYDITYQSFHSNMQF